MEVDVCPALQLPVSMKRSTTILSDANPNCRWNASDERALSSHQQHIAMFDNHRRSINENYDKGVVRIRLQLNFRISKENIAHYAEVGVTAYLGVLKMHLMAAKLVAPLTCPSSIRK